MTIDDVLQRLATEVPGCQVERVDNGSAVSWAFVRVNGREWQVLLRSPQHSNLDSSAFDITLEPARLDQAILDINRSLANG